MKNLLLLVGVAALLGLAAGRAHASGDEAGPWLRELYRAPRVTHGDVLLAVALMSDDKIWRPDPEWALKVCDHRGYLHDRPPRGARLQPWLKKHARRGFAASLFARLLEIDGGLWSRVFNQGPRYAYRELVILGIVAPGGDKVPLDGDELAGILLAAERYRKIGPERLPQRGVVQ